MYFRMSQSSLTAAFLPHGRRKTPVIHSHTKEKDFQSYIALFTLRKLRNLFSAAKIQHFRDTCKYLR